MVWVFERYIRKCWVNRVNGKMCRSEVAARSAILTLIKLKFLMVHYSYQKRHILLHSNGQAIWSGFPDITQIKKIMADNRPPWPSFCQNIAQFRTHPSYYWNGYRGAYGINFWAIHKKNQGHRGHRKIKCEISQALVMMFDVHSTYAKHVIVLKVADRRTDRRTDQPDDAIRHPPKYW